MGFFPTQETTVEANGSRDNPVFERIWVAVSSELIISCGYIHMTLPDSCQSYHHRDLPPKRVQFVVSAKRQSD
jgi:hypothetical protein